MAQRIQNGSLNRAAFKRSQGFTYMGLLLFVAIAGIGLAATGMTWHSKIKVENEQQLLFVGSQYRNALNSYYDSTPSGKKTYPLSLQELLLDKRFPNVKRHIRKLYPDPMTGKAEWGINRTQGRIVGVYSLSNQKPFKLAGFSNENQSFSYAKSYRQWLFGQVSTDDTAKNTASKETAFKDKVTGSQGSNNPASKSQASKAQTLKTPAGTL